MNENFIRERILMYLMTNTVSKLRVSNLFKKQKNFGTGKIKNKYNRFEN